MAITRDHIFNVVGDKNCSICNRPMFDNVKLANGRIYIVDTTTNLQSEMHTVALVCDTCGHIEFFRYTDYFNKKQKTNGISDYNKEGLDTGTSYFKVKGQKPKTK